VLIGDQLWKFRKVCSPPFSALEVETARQSETLVNYQTTRRHVPKDWFHHLWCLWLIALLQASLGVCVESIRVCLEMQNNAGRSQSCEQATISYVLSVRLSSSKYSKLPEDNTGMSKHVGVNIIFVFPPSPSQCTLQSVRGHSAVVLTVTVNCTQLIHPVDISPINFNHDLCFVPSRWSFLITHNTLQSVWLLWTSDQLVAETSTWQHTTLKTNIRAPSGIRTHDLSRRAAADLRLRLPGICDWRTLYNEILLWYICICIFGWNKSNKTIHKKKRYCTCLNKHKHNSGIHEGNIKEISSWSFMGGWRYIAVVLCK
jgi:hypothetical protein